MTNNGIIGIGNLWYTDQGWLKATITATAVKVGDLVEIDGMLESELVADWDQSCRRASTYNSVPKAEKRAFFEAHQHMFRAIDEALKDIDLPDGVEYRLEGYNDSTDVVYHGMRRAASRYYRVDIKEVKGICLDRYETVYSASFDLDA